MDINNLTEQEAIELLNTDFGPDMEKQAAAIVEAEEYIEYGQELALEKIAQMEASYEEVEEYGQEKIASADEASEYIQQGFVEAMMKLGQANYNDELIYLEEMAKEAGKTQEAIDFARAYGAKAGKGISNAASKAKKSVKDATKAVKSHYTDPGMKRDLSYLLKGKKGAMDSAIDRLKMKGAAPGSRGEAAKRLAKHYKYELGGAGALGAGTAAYKYNKREE